MSRLTSSPMTEVSRFRVVLDTNVILAALLSRNPASPTVHRQVLCAYGKPINGSSTLYLASEFG